MPCLSSSAVSALNESIRASKAASQLALPFIITTFFGSSENCSPKGSAVWTGAGGGVGVWAAAGVSAGDLVSAGGGAGEGAGAGGAGGGGGAGEGGGGREWGRPLPPKGRAGPR